jgi:prophage antirepressor-like protein
MDILKAFNLIENIDEIIIKGTHENPLFHAKQIGNLLGIVNMRDATSNFTDDEKSYDLIESSGGLQKTAFLTEIGLYRLLCNSRKPMAHIFQNWIINRTKDIRVNGMYKLKEENEVDKKLIIQQYELITHKNLIKAYDLKNVIYICRLKILDDKNIIKIGSTQNIKERIYNINNIFENIQIFLLDVIELNNYRKFEKYLHNNNFIKKYSYQLMKKDETKSRETYLVSNDELKELLKFINIDKKKYQDINIKEIEELKLKRIETELEKIKIKEEYDLKQKELEFEIFKYKFENNINSVIKETNETEFIAENEYSLNQKETNEIEFSADEEFDLDNEFSTDEEFEIDDKYLSATKEIKNEKELIKEELDLTKVNFQLKKRSNGNRSPKVYQYLPDNLSTPIKVYDSPSEVERSIDLFELHISSMPLRLAAKNNTIYKGFRWLFLNRNLELPLTISDTIDTRHKSPEIKYIAMIDIKKTKILEVYATQKDAVEARNIKSRSFTRAIQQQSISSGHYWNYFDNCSEEMKTEYLKNNKLPEKYFTNIGKKVEQIDPKTNNVLKVYNSNRDIIKNFQMSTLTLQKCLKSGEIYNGYIWRNKINL